MPKSLKFLVGLNTGLPTETGRTRHGLVAKIVSIGGLA